MRERHPEEVEGRAGGTQPPPSCVLLLQTDDDKWEGARWLALPGSGLSEDETRGGRQKPEWPSSPMSP